MCKESLTEDLRSFTGGKAWISKRKLRTWMGMGDTKLDEFLKGVDSRANGNRIEYFIGDIAEEIMKERVR